MATIRGRPNSLPWLRLLALFCAMLVAPLAMSAQATFNAELNDVWASPGEPGWGLQIVEQGAISFATLFVNDAGGRPTFFTAFLSPGAASARTGDLIETNGPYFGSASYDPALFGARRVGALTFTPVNSSTATLEYSVNGVAVTKTVTRQLWRYENFTGRYVATAYVVTSHCSNSSDDGERTVSSVIAIDQVGTAVTITGNFAKPAAASCTYYGDYTQAGRVGAVGSSYTCADGDEGAMSFFEMTRRPGMFSGRLQGHSISDSCDYSGAITGLAPL